MNVIDKDCEHTSEFKHHKNNHCFFLWEKAEINQELIKVNKILKRITRTEVFFM